MDCLRSFSILSSANENAVGVNIDTWTVGSQNFWIYNSFSGDSTFNVQGFKNINVYSIQAQGDVSCLINTGNSLIVDDWAFSVELNGQPALASGEIVASPNRFSIQIQGDKTNCVLSRYNNNLNFASPIQSVKNIKINGLTASGIGNENLTTLNLSWAINFIVYYKYEGE